MKIHFILFKSHILQLNKIIIINSQSNIKNLQIRLKDLKSRFDSFY